jgi:hypothetical protein
MGLISNYKKTTSDSIEFMSGVFVNEVTITNVEPVYGGTDWQHDNYKDDIGLSLTIDIGQSFEPTHYIGGRLKKDDFGEVTSLGTARRINTFFEAIDVDVKLTDDHKFEEDALRDCMGRKYLRLTYVSGKRNDGKLKYSDFQEVAKAGENKRVLIDTFKKHVSNEWIKNYRPENMDRESVNKKFSPETTGSNDLSTW